MECEKANCNGVITIKLSEGDQLRRFTFKQVPDIAALEGEIRQLLSIPPGVQIQLLYKDEEEDDIFMNSNLEFMESVSCAKNDILRLNLRRLPVVAHQTPAENEKSGQSIDPPQYSPYLAPAWRISGPNGAAEPCGNPSSIHGSVHDHPYAPPHVHPHGLSHSHPRGPHHGHPHGPMFPPGHLRGYHHRHHFNPRPDRGEWKEMKHQMKSMALEKRMEIKQAKQAFKEDKKIFKQHMKQEKHQMRCDEKEPNELVARFICNVTIPEGSVISAGSSFAKIWRFRNDGRIPWPSGCSLLLVGLKKGDRLGAPDATPLSTNQIVNPGDEVDVVVNLVAPQEPGRYMAFFRLADPSGRKFGQRVWTEILVPSSSSSESESSESVTHFGYDRARTTWAEQLNALEMMGFTHPHLNLRLLCKYKGNVEKVVKKLLKKEYKYGLREPVPAGPPGFV